MSVGGKEAKVFLSLHGEEFRRGLLRAQRDMKEFTSSVNQHMVELATVTAAAFAGITTLSVKAAMGAERAAGLLDQAVRSTGGAAGYTTEQLIAMSSALESTTTFADDAIQVAQRGLLKFGNIQGPVFEAALKSALDLATTMDKDVAGAITVVGKALNDPAAGFGALAKVGIQFSDSQKDVVKRLQETGHLVQAQQVILEQFNTVMGGQAVRAAQDAQGALDQLKNQLDNVGEAIGGLLLPRIKEYATALKEWVTSHRDEIVRVFSLIFDKIADLVNKGKDITTFLGEHWTAVKDGITVLAGLAATIYVVSTATTVWTAALKLNPVMLMISAIGLLVGGFVVLVNHMGGFQKVWIDLVAGMRRGMEAVRYEVVTLWDDLQHVYDFFKLVTSGVPGAIALSTLMAERQASGATRFAEHMQNLTSIIQDQVGAYKELEGASSHANDWQGPLQAPAAPYAPQPMPVSVPVKFEWQGPPTDQVWDAIKESQVMIEGWGEAVADPLAKPFDLARETVEKWKVSVMAAAGAAYGSMTREAAKFTKFRQIQDIQGLRMMVQGYREGAAAFIEAEGQKAATEAMMQAAWAIASLARGDFRGAAGHAAASAAFMALSGAAAVGASMVRGSGGQGAGPESAGREPTSGSSWDRGPSGRQLSTASAGGPVTNNYNFTLVYQGATVYGDGGLRQLGEDLLGFFREANAAGRLG